MNAVILAGIRKMLFAAASCMLSEILESSVVGLESLERLPVTSFCITSGAMSSVSSQEESLM